MKLQKKIVIVYPKTVINLNKAKNIITNINNVSNISIKKYFPVTYTTRIVPQIKNIFHLYDTTLALNTISLKSYLSQS